MVKYSREPMAASREPMMKVTEITLLIRMPMSCAVSKSRDTARMAMPIRVWLAFLIGICESIIKGSDWSVFSDAFTFAILIVVLCVKPTGLFGEKVTDKV